MDSGVSYTVYNDLYDYVDIQLSYPGATGCFGFHLINIGKKWSNSNQSNQIMILNCLGSLFAVNEMRNMVNMIDCSTRTNNSSARQPVHEGKNRIAFNFYFQIQIISLI